MGDVVRNVRVDGVPAANCPGVVSVIQPHFFGVQQFIVEDIGSAHTVVASMANDFAPRELLRHIGDCQVRGRGIGIAGYTGIISFLEKAQLQIDFAVVAVFVLTGVESRRVGVKGFEKGVDILFRAGDVEELFFGMKG